MGQAEVTTFTTSCKDAVYAAFQTGGGTRDLCGPEGLTTEQFIALVARDLASRLSIKQPPWQRKRRRCDVWSGRGHWDRSEANHVFPQPFRSWLSKCRMKRPSLFPKRRSLWVLATMQRLHLKTTFRTLSVSFWINRASWRK